MIVVTDERGNRARVRPLRQRCFLPLAKIKNPGGLRLDEFRAFALCKLVFELLDSDFEKLLVERPPSRPPSISRGFSAEDLHEIRELTQPPPAGVDVFVSRWFKVPKSDGVWARLVQDLGLLSDYLDPPKVPFTNLHVLMQKILRANFAATGDLKNWFYQIPIPEAWRRWFGARLASGRGSFEIRCLFVLSMGLAISVFIAHVLSLAIAAFVASENLSSDAWVDNLLWLGERDEHFAGFQERVSAAERRFNCVWSETPTRTRRFDFVGIFYDLLRKRARLCDKIRQKLLEASRKLESTSSLPLREALAEIGLCVWSNYAVGRYPLSFFESLLRWLSSTAASPSTLDETVEIPPEVCRDLARLTSLCAEADIDLDDLECPPHPGITAFSDASDKAIAAVSRHDGAAFVSAAPTDATLPIFAREALAHLLAVMTVPRGVRAAGFAIDNTNWLHALWRGHSRSGELNAVLRHLFTRIAATDLTIFAGYVPSAQQLADHPSRGRPLPTNWEDFFKLPLSLRQIPFFRPPPSAATSS